jgi:peptidase E
MKLFLASSADKTLQLLKAAVPDIGSEVVFIANAADPYPAPHYWVDADREAFISFGFTLHEVDMRTARETDFATSLRSASVIHMCGGSVYYLMSLIRDSRCEDLIRDTVLKNGVIYTGTSAGSMVVSANLKPYSHYEEERSFVERVPDHRGLGFIDFGIIPHCNNSDFAKDHKSIIDQAPFDAEALLFLQDSQALFIDDGRMQILKASQF